MGIRHQTRRLRTLRPHHLPPRTMSSAADDRTGGKGVSQDFLTKLRQDGVIRPQGLAFAGSAGASSKVSNGGKIAALSTLYIAMTYALSGAGSAAGVEAGAEEGRDNNHP